MGPYFKELLSDYKYTNVLLKTKKNLYLYEKSFMTEDDPQEGKDVLFENDNYEFFETSSHDVAVYYGGENAFGKNVFRNQYRYGHLYFLINKNNHDSSLYIHIDDNGRTEIETFDSETLSLGLILNEYPFLEKFIGDKINWYSQTTYLGLKALSEGNYPKNEWALEHMDDLIHRTKLATKTPRNSVLFLRFKDEDSFFKTFDIHEDDVWILNIVFNDYGSGYDFLDNSDDYDWREGRVFYAFNQENKNKLNEILELLSPDLSLDNDDDQNLSNIAKLFDNVYPDFGNDVFSEYVSYENQSRNEQFKKEVIDDLCDIYSKFGIYKKSGCFWEYIVTTGSILRLYEKTKLYNLDLYGLISHLGHTLDVTSYSEYIYEVYGDFDGESFNNSISRYVDNFYESIMEGDMFKDVNEYRKIMNDVQKKYDFKRWYEFPSDENSKFLINQINPETNQLDVAFKRGNKEGSGRRLISLEDFNNTISNMSLF